MFAVTRGKRHLDMIAEHSYLHKDEQKRKKIEEEEQVFIESTSRWLYQTTCYQHLQTGGVETRFLLQLSQTAR